jgi:hypothetical protein
MFMLMLLGALAATYRRLRIRFAIVEPTYHSDGGCYSDF